MTSEEGFAAPERAATSDVIDYLRQFERDGEIAQDDEEAAFEMARQRKVMREAVAEWLMLRPVGLIQSANLIRSVCLLLQSRASQKGAYDMFELDGPNWSEARTTAAAGTQKG